MQQFVPKHIFPDVQHFNAALRSVETRKLTGLSEQQKINMAVAVHLGKAKTPHYRFKDFDPVEWPNYYSWRYLRDCPKFQPQSLGRSDRVDELVAQEHEARAEVEAEADRMLDEIQPTQPKTGMPSRGHRGPGQKKSKHRQIESAQNQNKKADLKQLISVLQNRNAEMHQLGELMKVRTLYKIAKESGDGNDVAKARKKLKEVAQQSLPQPPAPAVQASTSQSTTSTEPCNSQSTTSTNGQTDTVLETITNNQQQIRKSTQKSVMRDEDDDDNDKFDEGDEYNNDGE